MGLLIIFTKGGLMMNFNELTSVARPMLKKIVQLPFIKEISNGTLAMEKFIFYIQQDKIYLTEFSKALALISTKIVHEEHRKCILEFSLDTLKAEHSLHDNYLLNYTEDFTTSISSPTCFMYTNFLLKTISTEPVQEAFVSLIPCFWIYQEVGEHIKRKSQYITNNPYQNWIDLYSSEKFKESTECAIVILNNLIARVSSDQRKSIRYTFIQAIRLEWAFWNSAYIHEQWPI